MKIIVKDITVLTVAAMILTVLIYAVARYADLGDHHAGAILLPALFLMVSVISLLIFHRGLSSGTGAKGYNYTLAAVTVKFLLGAMIAVLWFLLLKRDSISDVVLFFVVYLSFSVATVLLIVRSLRNKT